MQQLGELSKERDAMGTMGKLSSAFEGIASMRISQIKDQVLMSQKFFADLWQIYSQVRVEEYFGFGRDKDDLQVSPKELLILITSEGSFSGDIDQRLIAEVMKTYDPLKNDIIVIGHHGAVQLTQNNVKYVRSFKTPVKDKDINVGPLVAETKKYSSTAVYYQNYISLTNQEVKRIQLGKALNDRGQQIQAAESVINEKTYIFEPSTYDVVKHLETSMINIMLAEVILESKLAQYASRFKAMSGAKEKSGERLLELVMYFNRAKRHVKDERLKEIMNGLRNNR